MLPSVRLTVMRLPAWRRTLCGTRFGRKSDADGVTFPMFRSLSRQHGVGGGQQRRQRLRKDVLQPHRGGQGRGRDCL